MLFVSFVFDVGIIFQETQTDQPSNNFPWFLDLNPPFQCTELREDALLFSHATFSNFCCCCFLFFMCMYFWINSNRPAKQRFHMIIWRNSINPTWSIDKKYFYLGVRTNVFILWFVYQSVIFGLELNFMHKQKSKQINLDIFHTINIIFSENSKMLSSTIFHAQIVSK